jgi:hypothetical protein
VGPSALAYLPGFLFPTLYKVSVRRIEILVYPIQLRSTPYCTTYGVQCNILTHICPHRPESAGVSAGVGGARGEKGLGEDASKCLTIKNNLARVAVASGMVPLSNFDSQSLTLMLNLAKTSIERC